MTDPNLDDVPDTHEHPVPDHHEHAKKPKNLNDDELARRTEQERAATGAQAPPTIDDQVEGPTS